MKNLLYKEFKLSVHPLTYLFMGVMALVCLSPGIPAFIPILYFGVTYTFLFIGMNKTTTTNDLFYTCNLPLRREDVVKARVLTTTVLQLIELVLVFSFLSITRFIFIEGMKEDMAKYQDLMNTLISIDITHGIFLAGVYLVCFAVFDLIYLPWFYKNGKSIILNMFVAIIAVTIVGAALCIVPYFTFKDLLVVGGEHANYFLQFGFLAFAILSWIGSKIIVTKLSARNLVRLDF